MPQSFTAPGVSETMRAVAAGDTDPRETIRACAAQARACEPAVGAFNYLAPSPEDADPGRGPLAGVCVGVKDIIDTKDMPTTYGSAAFADHVPAEDAAVVKRLKALSATLLGKTATTEFAWRHPAPTRNPWNTAHTPGGSSAGSAAAVATGAVAVALGTQTYGSVIRPAAYCGVVGLKPSFGAIDRTGVHPLSQALDHVGLFTRSVDDAAVMLSLLQGGEGAPPFPPFQEPPAGLSPYAAPRIGLLKGADWEKMEEDQRQIVLEAADRISASGGIVEEFALPAEFGALLDIAATICAAEGAANLGPIADRFPDETTAPVQDLVTRGRAVPALDYIAALRAQAVLRRAFFAAMTGFDALLSAPAYGEAPEGLGNTGDPSLCVPWTAIGVPAITIPAGTGDKGLPLGIQLLAPFAHDLKLLRVAKTCAEALAQPVRIPQAA